MSATKRIQVGEAFHHVPSGSKLHYVRDGIGGELCYVLTPTGQVRCFTAQSEVDVPDRLQAALRRSKFETS